MKSMNNCEYVRQAYQVPVCIGRLVSYKGRSGIISEDRGNYIGVTFDDEPANRVSNFHPTTEGLVYLGMGTVRKMTASQARYQAYLRSADCFSSFREFLRSRASKRKIL